MAREGKGGQKLWAGRLPVPTARSVEEYTTSLEIDRRLYPEDIECSLAHAEMLQAIGVLTAAEHRAIVRGLGTVRRELDGGTFVVTSSDEDIHTAVERRLHEIIGPAAGKLHTGRSRNDQVVTDLRLYARRRCRQLMLAVAALQEALVERADEHRSTRLPGYTHGQRGQVVSLAHHLLAYVEMLERDVERLRGAHTRCDVLPLGSGALAGSTLALDRRLVASRLGFSRISANSMDAVSDRDFVVEITAACALVMVHISRLAEDLVLWMTAEFGFAELPDTHATGSSLMPQKKNPDVLELARGRTGRVIGALTSLLTLLKGLPLTYNRDLQEDKPALFDAVDVAAATLTAVTDVVAVVRFDTVRMASAASDPDLMATDIAEYLVTRGVPFREAHGIVGSAVRDVHAAGGSLADLTVADWRSRCDRVDEEIVALFGTASLGRRSVEGGPGPRPVARQLGHARRRVAATRAFADG